jgi:hypothetical protein
MIVTLITTMMLITATTEQKTTFQHKPISEQALWDYIHKSGNHPLKKNPEQVRKLVNEINDAGATYSVPPALLLTMAQRESSLLPSVGSGKIRGKIGEQGFVQVHGAAKNLCVKQNINPNSITCGALWLDHLRTEAKLNDIITTCRKAKLCSLQYNPETPACYISRSKEVNTICVTYWYEQHLPNTKHLKRYSDDAYLERALRTYMSGDPTKSKQGAKDRLDSAYEIETKYGIISDFGG